MIISSEGWVEKKAHPIIGHPFLCIKRDCSRGLNSVLWGDNRSRRRFERACKYIFRKLEFYLKTNMGNKCAKNKGQTSFVCTPPHHHLESNAAALQQSCFFIFLWCCCCCEMELFLQVRFISRNGHKFVNCECMFSKSLCICFTIRDWCLEKPMSTSPRLPKLAMLLSNHASHAAVLCQVKILIPYNHHDSPFWEQI